ncbi:vWA domain-containing protein [Mycolicibacterium sp. XJ1819]
MTDPNATLVAALLDRSGSMTTSQHATEDGWRELINGQRQLPGECRVTLAQFDDEYDVVYSNTPIAEVPEFIIDPRGRTALLDAVGRFVTEIGDQLSARPEGQRPGHVICLIMTDGMENASRRWDWNAVKQLITRQQDEWNWKFIFIGANIDAIDVSGQMGVDAGASISYDDSSYDSTVGVMTVAREMVRRSREDDDTPFSDEDRRAAMGDTTG